MAQQAAVSLAEALGVPGSHRERRAELLRQMDAEPLVWPEGLPDAGELVRAGRDR